MRRMRRSDIMNTDTYRIRCEFNENTGLPAPGGYKKKYAHYTIYAIFTKGIESDIKERVKKEYPFNSRCNFAPNYKHGANAIVEIWYKND